MQINIYTLNGNLRSAFSEATTYEFPFFLQTKSVVYFGWIWNVNLKSGLPAGIVGIKVLCTKKWIFNSARKYTYIEYREVRLDHNHFWFEHSFMETVNIYRYLQAVCHATNHKHYVCASCKKFPKEACRNDDGDDDDEDATETWSANKRMNSCVYLYVE